MKIETKYEIGQNVFVKDDGEWWKGELRRVSHDGIQLYYDIEVSEIYRYFSLTEAEIIIDEPQEFRDTKEFLNLFPQFDKYEKAELLKLIRRLQKDSAKRIEADTKKTEPAL
jgi:hypothetical protein